ncbi:aldehyde reductase [Colletotrichum abscissum]|uniref:Aldehyde reductase n=1 Tax=Colletotrichum abscissum TaxID=1671311 RepID=A0A9Q0B3I7_9PEZI|nr:aldehyde reductase [Colletotrichum abscissum]KAI3550021.1 aldehyde reductase [Colletotrichum abscissum]KAK1498690.1 aldehyde reductase [Colletotrichum abscissum]
MPIPGIPQPAVPYGSLVVISGVSGFIGSHVADQAISAGYRVRGTTRDVSKSQWLEDYFQTKYGSHMFHLASVPDMEAPDAFNEAVQGAVGFIHVANDMQGSRDPAVAIPRAVNGALNAAKASSEADLKRFVFTSSSFAVTQPKPGKVFTLTAESFNEEAVERIKQPGADGETVYSASKVEAERALSRWAKENKSSLIINTVQPNANIGPLINAEKQGYPTSARWVKKLWDQDYDSLRNTPPQHFVNVQDDARLHVIGLVHPQVRGERLFAIAGPVNLQDIIEILRESYPFKHWEDFPTNERDLSSFIPSRRAEELLIEAYGTGFIGLVESVKGNAANLV